MNDIKDALTLAHNSYYKGLRSYASFKLNDGALGEDLVQDTFKKTWLYMVKGGNITIMRAFLYHVLNNIIVDEYRKQKHGSTSLDVLIERGLEPGDENHESTRLPDYLDGRSAMMLIKHLPKIYRKVMRMRYVQDLTFKEISHITGKTKNAIAVQIFRGLDKLKVLYFAGKKGGVII